jgi:hypothetical protein
MALVCIYSSCFVFLVVVSFPVAARIARTLELAFLAVRWMFAGFFCVVRNASYVDEIYYCSIGSGSQNISRRLVNSFVQALDSKGESQISMCDFYALNTLFFGYLCHSITPAPDVR